MAKEELYVSVDIEADGPYPGDYSMLSVGCAFFTKTGENIGLWSANLELLPGAKQDPKTMAWWAEQGEAYELTRKFCQSPEKAMKHLAAVLNGYKSRNYRPTFVGYPVTYDFMWVYWYLMKFAGECPAGFAGKDLKTLASAVLNVPFHTVGKRSMPKHWFEGAPEHAHVAAVDALEQGMVHHKMMLAQTELHRVAAEAKENSNA